MGTTRAGAVGEVAGRGAGERILSAGFVLVLVTFDAVGLVQVLRLRLTGYHTAASAFGIDYAILFWVGIASSAMAALMALLLALRGGRRPGSHSAAIALAALAAAGLAFLILGTPYVRKGTYTWTLVMASLPLLPLFLSVGLFGAIRFAVLFPRPLSDADLSGLTPFSPVCAADGEGGHRRRRWYEVTVLPRAGRVVTRPGWLLVTLALHVSLFYVAVALDFGTGVGRHGWVDSLIPFVLAVWTITIPLLLLLPVVLFRFGYRRASDEDRRRARWLLAGFNAALVAAAVLIMDGLVLEVAGIDHVMLTDILPALLMALIPLSVLMGVLLAVFYHGALEPALVVRRSTVYGLFGFGLAFTFGIVEEVVTEHIAVRLGLPDGTGTLVASGVIAAAFGAFHGRFRRRIDTWLSERESADGAAVRE